MAIFKKPKIQTQARKRRDDIPQGLFQKCPGCNEVVSEIELAENVRVCPRCDHHFTLSAKDRLGNLLDGETFVEMDADLRCVSKARPATKIVSKNIRRTPGSLTPRSPVTA
jgi:acetyl-CoA carboxylase carboxyl transferase subunit beta